MYECNNIEENPYLLPKIHLIFKENLSQTPWEHNLLSEFVREINLPQFRYESKIETEIHAKAESRTVMKCDENRVEIARTEEKKHEFAKP